MLRPEPQLNHDWGFDLDLPYEHLAVYARDLDSAAALTRLPLFAIASFAINAASLAAMAEADRDRQPTLPQVPLGVIGTDHVGYGSFDLWPLRHVQVMEALRQALSSVGWLDKGKPRVVVGLGRLLVLPYKDPNLAFDALVEGDRAARFITLRMDLDAAMTAGRATWPPMPAMQTPGILDWRLSPGSFSMSGALLIGEDGCETMLPANLATRLIRFRQLVRTQAVATAALPRADQAHVDIFGPGFHGEVRLGYQIQYHTEWFPLGHSLGQIAYSLPLAPGEKMKIAIVDWTRHDAAKRTENTDEKEDLQHAALRDRSLSESVDMVVRESQSGSSFMAGVALSAGAGIPIGPVSLGVGGAFGIGGASSDSEGMRSIVGETTQQISDAFHQASSAQRELNSTVVVQADQTEAGQAKTRTVANYNHSHALTILYYEVLHHQRLLTRPASVRPALFLRHGTPKFSSAPTPDAGYSLVERYKSAIGGALLDESVRGCLDVITKRACLALNLEREKKKLAERGDPLDDTTLGEMTLRFRSGAVGVNPTYHVTITVVAKAGGQRIPCNMSDPSQAASAFGVTYPTIFANLNTASGILLDPAIKPNSEYILQVRPSTLINWNNVAAVEIGMTIAPANEINNPPANDGWILDDVRIATTGPTGAP